MDVIARQSAELAQLRQQLDSTKNNLSTEQLISEMEERNKVTLATLQQKELLLQQKEKEIENLLSKMNNIQEEVEDENDENDNDENDDEKLKESNKLLAEKEELLQSKEEQIKELQLQWQAERAELIKPALEEVTSQLDQLKKTVKIIITK